LLCLENCGNKTKQSKYELKSIPQRPFEKGGSVKPTRECSGIFSRTVTGLVRFFDVHQSSEPRRLRNVIENVPDEIDAWQMNLRGNKMRRGSYLLGLERSLWILIACCTVANAQSSFLSIDPSPAFIGRIPVGSDDSQNFSIFNVSSSTVSITGISLGGPSKDRFSVVNNPAPCSIESFSEINLAIQYTPTAAGKDVAILQIELGTESITDTLVAWGTETVSGLQTFERLLGKKTILVEGKIVTVSQNISSLVQTQDSGFVMVGSSKNLSAGNSSWALMIKTDRYGKFEWERDFSAGASGGIYGGGQDGANDVLTLNNGNIIVLVGTRSWGAGNRDIVLSKWDAEGNFVWEKAYGGALDDDGSHLIEDNQGYLLVVGYTRNTPDQRSNSLVLKIDPNDGTLIWSNKYGADNVESGSDIVETHGGGYMFVGNAVTPTSNICFVRIDRDGVEQWHKILTSSTQSKGNVIRKTGNGGYIVAGYTFTDTGGIDGYLVRVDTNASLQWTRSFGTSHIDQFSSVIQTPDNGYLCIGAINQFFSIQNVYDDLWVLKTDSEGNSVWERRFGGSLDDGGNDVIATNEGSYAIIGHTQSFNNDPNEIRIYFLQVDLNGNVTGVRSAKDELSQTPVEFVLHQNYPNPFNPSTTIEFEIAHSPKPSSNHVLLEIFDLLGNEIATLVDGSLAPGYYKVEFDANRPSGRNLSSGIYFYRLIVGSAAITKKMILLK